MISAKHARRALAIGLVAGAVAVPARSASAAAPSITVEVTCDQATQTTSVQAHGSGFTPARVYSVNLAIATTFQQVGQSDRWTSYRDTPYAQKRVTVAADGTWTAPLSWQQTPPASSATFSYFAHTPSVIAKYYDEYTRQKGSPCVFINAG